MAVNLTAASTQANQLSAYALKLETAKAQLSSYRSVVQESWQADEARYFTAAIEQVIKQIDSAAEQLRGLSSDVKSAVSAIKSEEEAKQAKQRRIQAAQTDYDRSVAECNALYEKRTQLQKLMEKNISSSQQKAYQKTLDELAEKITEAEKKKSTCYNSLTEVKR